MTEYLSLADYLLIAEAVLDVPAEDFRKVVDVNFYGVLFSDRAAARWMVEQRRAGSIVNLASVAAKRPTPTLMAAWSVSVGFAAT